MKKNLMEHFFLNSVIPDWRMGEVIFDQSLLLIVIVKELTNNYFLYEFETNIGK